MIFFLFRRLLDDNLQRWSSESLSNDDDEDEDEDEVDEEDQDHSMMNGSKDLDEDDQMRMRNTSKDIDEDLENSIFQKLGQAQPIPPSEIPDFQAR
jgi:hypothetical protein